MGYEIVILGAGVSGKGSAILAKKHGYDVLFRRRQLLLKELKNILINWELIGKRINIHSLKCMEQNM